VGDGRVVQVQVFQVREAGQPLEAVVADGGVRNAQVAESGEASQVVQGPPGRPEAPPERVVPQGHAHADLGVVQDAARRHGRGLEREAFEAREVREVRESLVG
jgi:hypothetical protein